MSAIKYVGFDLDGTLIDSMSDISQAFGEIMQEQYGIEEQEAAIHMHETAGLPTAQQVSSLFAKHNIIFPKEQILQRGHEIAILIGERAKAHPFPDAKSTLQELKNRNYGIFVSSGHQETVVKHTLERTSLIEYVDFLAGTRPNEPEYVKGESHFRGAAKYFKTPYEEFVKQTIYIGDAPADIRLATECKIKSIGRIGYKTEEELLRVGANKALRDFSQLSTILENL
jgi:phosphoglycolate phosphatase-like HAD superfamily hydrolase